MGSVRVGSSDVEVAAARDLIERYVNPGPGIVTGYAHYDSLDTGGPATGPLVDGDLLAPNLLNAAVDLKRFDVLAKVRDEMQRRLDRIPVGADLADADDATVDLLEDMFAILDGLVAQRSGVGPVIFSKVLHRKRPGLIPIIDTNVMWCYCHEQDRPAPVPVSRGRSWAAFAVALARAMREDLRDGRDTWAELAAVPDRPMSRLRALDIVAWRTGDHPPEPDDMRQ